MTNACANARRIACKKRGMFKDDSRQPTIDDNGYAGPGHAAGTATDIFMLSGTGREPRR